MHTDISHDITSSISLPVCFGAYEYILVSFVIQEYDRLKRNISRVVSFIISKFQNPQLLLSQHTSQKLINII